MRQLLETDREVKVRQAALTVLKFLIKGFSQDAIQVSKCTPQCCVYNNSNMIVPHTEPLKF